MKENLLLRFIPQWADPSMAATNLQNSCSQYFYQSLHHNKCPDSSIAMFLQRSCSQYVSGFLHGSLLLVCSQDASGFLHHTFCSQNASKFLHRVPFYPSPSSHILTQNLWSSETVSCLESIFICFIIRACDVWWKQVLVRVLDSNWHKVINLLGTNLTESSTLLFGVCLIILINLTGPRTFVCV